MPSPVRFLALRAVLVVTILCLVRAAGEAERRQQVSLPGEGNQDPNVPVSIEGNQDPNVPEGEEDFDWSFCNKKFRVITYTRPPFIILDPSKCRKDPLDEKAGARQSKHISKTNTQYKNLSPHPSMDTQMCVCLSLTVRAKWCAFSALQPDFALRKPLGIRARILSSRAVEDLHMTCSCKRWSNNLKHTATHRTAIRQSMSQRSALPSWLSIKRITSGSRSTGTSQRSIKTLKRVLSR
jgi:hypothetical protein